MSSLPPAPDPITESRLAPRILLAAALLCMVYAGLVDLNLPWVEDAIHGRSTLTYTAEWLRFHHEYGLAVTWGAPVSLIIDGQPPTVVVNWHHPPLYPLYLYAWTCLLGLEPWVVRIAHLVLFLPSILALYRLVGRHATRFAAGLAALLFASSPYVVHCGLLPLQDGITLSLGLVTCWLFQRHLDDPVRHRWWWPAIAFMACGMNDIPGYFVGVAMFCLALGHQPRSQGLVAVARMFAVSVVTFALTAIYYGWFLGGPVEFVRSMLTMAEAEGGGFGTEAWKAAGSAQARMVLWQFSVAGLLVLSAVSVVAAVLRRPHAARLLWLGLALAMPGILNALVFCGHAPHHLYWYVPAFGGVAVAAAASAAVAMQRISTPGVRKRWIDALLLSACLGVAVHGVFRTHLVRSEFQPQANGLQVLAKVRPMFQGVQYVLTTEQVGLGRLLGSEYVVGAVSTLEFFELMLSIAANNGLVGDVAFVMTTPWFDSPLRTRLEAISTVSSASGVLVFRFRLPLR